MWAFVLLGKSESLSLLLRLSWLRSVNAKIHVQESILYIKDKQLNKEVIKIQGKALLTHPSQGLKVINKRASIRLDSESDLDSDDLKSSNENEDDKTSDKEMKLNFIDINAKSHFQ